MKATLEEKKVFDVTVGGKTFTDMRFDSKWNGLSKYVSINDPDISIIVNVPESPLGSYMDDIFGKSIGIGVEVVAMSEKLAIAKDSPDDGEPVIDLSSDHLRRNFSAAAAPNCDTCDKVECRMHPNFAGEMTRQ